MAIMVKYISSYLSLISNIMTAVNKKGIAGGVSIPASLSSGRHYFSLQKTLRKFFKLYTFATTANRKKRSLWRIPIIKRRWWVRFMTIKV
jgi:hypothetical protein